MDEDSLYFEFEFKLVKDQNMEEDFVLLKMKNITTIVRNQQK